MDATTVPGDAGRPWDDPVAYCAGKDSHVLFCLVNAPVADERDAEMASAAYTELVLRGEVD
jgi:hypothetical protein